MNINETFAIAVNCDNETPTVDGRELHAALMIETPYQKWFPRMCEYGFVEGKSYWTILSNRSDGLAGKPRTDHKLTISMAKELCMIQRTEIGRRFRQYFIHVEEAWNNPEAVLARALQVANRKIEEIQTQNMSLATTVNEQATEIAKLKPRAAYTDTILQSKDLVNISQIAKDYGMSAQALNKKLHELGVQYKQNGQWLLYARYAGKFYASSRTEQIKGKNGESKVVMRTLWSQKGRLLIYAKLKNEGILPLIER